MANGVSFNEDDNLGLPARRERKAGGGGLTGLVMRLGLAKSEAGAQGVLLAAFIVIAVLTVAAFVVLNPKPVQPHYDPTDPALKDQTL